MNENKVPHTVVPQEEVEKMADAFVDSFFVKEREYDKLKRNSCTPQKAYVAGYNAAIQSQFVDSSSIEAKEVVAFMHEVELQGYKPSYTAGNWMNSSGQVVGLDKLFLQWRKTHPQSVQPTDSAREIAGLEGDIAAFEKFEKECKELADTTAYAYYAFNEGLSHARSQSQSIQPTGSVREIAHEIYMNCFRIPDEMNYQEQTEDIAERIEKWLSSAAKNLPVQSIQLSDMFEAMVHGLLVSPGYYKCEKKDIDIEHWQKNFDKWVAWYMENKGHSPVADSRIEEMQKWLDTMPCWYDEDGTAQIDAEMVRDRFNQIFQ